MGHGQPFDGRQISVRGCDRRTWNLSSGCSRPNRQDGNTRQGRGSEKGELETGHAKIFEWSARGQICSGLTQFYGAGTMRHNAAQ
jgi:hypothetical protein